MKNPDDSFLIGRAKSFRYAFKGAYLLLRTEHSFITQFFFAAVFVVIGFVFQINKTEWMLQTFSMGLVLSIEGLNTAIEKLCDIIHPDYHKKVGFVKDISAGAVTFAALTAVVIILIIYFPHLYERNN